MIFVHSFLLLFGLVAEAKQSEVKNVYRDEDRVYSNTRITRSDFEPPAAIGPFKDFDVGERDYLGLSASGTIRSFEGGTHQVYLRLSYRENWRLYQSAWLKGGVSAEFSSISQEVLDCGGLGCSYEEDIVVSVPAKIVANAFTSGLDIQFQINAKSGHKNVVTVPSWFIQGYVRKVNPFFHVIDVIELEKRLALREGSSTKSDPKAKRIIPNKADGLLPHEDVRNLFPDGCHEPSENRANPYEGVTRKQFKWMKKVRQSDPFAPDVIEKLDKLLAQASDDFNRAAVLDWSVRAHYAQNDLVSAVNARYNLLEQESSASQGRTFSLEAEKELWIICTTGKDPYAYTATDSYNPIVYVTPKYPLGAISRGQTGWVKLEFTVDERGRVVHLTVLDNCARKGYKNGADCSNSSNNIFNKAALKAAQNFQFRPRLEKAMPVSTSGVTHIMTWSLM